MGDSAHVPDTTNGYLTAEEVAKLANVSTSTVRRWAKRGQIAASQLPGRGMLRFRRSDVEAMLARPAAS